jgi:hypothetical protein
MRADVEGEERLGRGDLAALSLIVLACLPALVFRYLPMTDLPQHMAVAAILLSPDDPSLGFSDYYEVELGKTLYLLPYLLTVGLSKILGLELAMRTVVFGSMIATPMGIWALLRAMGKPGWMAVLALPFVFNRAFFWGFLNFNLGIGLALLCLAIVIHPRRSRRRDVVLCGLGLAVSTTHIYGMAFLLGYGFIALVLGQRRELIRRFVPLAPAVLSLLVWALLAQRAMAFGEWVFLPLSLKLQLFVDDVFGGYPDSSELWILAAWLLALMVLMGRRLPLGATGWNALSTPERVFALYACLNLVLYFVLPHHTPTAKFIFFRHASLGLCLWPLLIPALPDPASLRIGRWLAGGVAAMVLLVHWSHLSAFDEEARDFDVIVEELPDAPRILPLNLDGNGSLSKSDPYAHFVAIAQVRRGGIIATTFPQLFWNIPLRLRDDLSREPTPPGFEFFPQELYRPAWAHWYTHVVARLPPEVEISPSPYFPFHLVAESGAWRLYERRDLAEDVDESEALR